MTDYGVIPEPPGFRRMPREVIRQRVVDEIHANVGPLVDCSPTSFLGKDIDIKVDQLDLIWGELEKVYFSNDPKLATGDALNAIGKITGTERRAASFSTVPVECELKAGTKLISGTHFVSMVDRPDVRFTPAADFTAPSDVTPALPFRAENAGAVQAPANTLTVIATPVVGWNNANNPSEAVPGREMDSDATLAERRENDLAKAGSSTQFAFVADLDAIPGIQSTNVFTNDTGTLDLATGLPPHSFEVLVHDDPSVDDDIIAQTIWNSKPAGIATYGSESGTATSPDDGSTHTVAFSRVNARDVYLTFDLTTGPEYVGDTAFTAAIAAAANAFFNKVGATVYRSRLWAFAFGVGIAGLELDEETRATLANTGVVDIVSLKLGFTVSPTNTADLVTGVRELPRFDSSRVEIV